MSRSQLGHAEVRWQYRMLAVPFRGSPQQRQCLPSYEKAPRGGPQHAVVIIILLATAAPTDAGVATDTAGIRSLANRGGFEGRDRAARADTAIPNRDLTRRCVPHSAEVGLAVRYCCAIQRRRVWAARGGRALESAAPVGRAPVGGNARTHLEAAGGAKIAPCGILVTRPRARPLTPGHRADVCAKRPRAVSEAGIRSIRTCWKAAR